MYWPPHDLYWLVTGCIIEDLLANKYVSTILLTLNTVATIYLDCIFFLLFLFQADAIEIKEALCHAIRALEPSSSCLQKFVPMVSKTC